MAEIITEFEIIPRQVVRSEGSDSVPLDIELLRKVPIDGLEEHTLVFEYNIGLERPGRYWGVLWYGSIAALETGDPELDSFHTPLNVSITPDELAETEGTHFFHLTFTPQFEGDHFLAFVLDPVDEPQRSPPVRPSEGMILVDVADRALMDSNGFYLIQPVVEDWTYLVDIEMYELVDTEGVRLVEVSEVL